MKPKHDKKLKSPAPPLSKFKVGDLVWSLAPPSSKRDPIFPDRVWVVLGLKAERTYETVNSATGKKYLERPHTCDMYHSIRHAILSRSNQLNILKS